jgi:hypothetical protein
MDRVHKPSDSDYYTPSSEPLDSDVSYVPFESQCLSRTAFYVGGKIQMVNARTSVV